MVSSEGYNVWRLMIRNLFDGPDLNLWGQARCRCKIKAEPQYEICRQLPVTSQSRLVLTVPARTKRLQTKKLMADYEGYLLLHGVHRQADPLYFELEGGLLQFYDKKDGRRMGQFTLTRHRVTVQLIGDNRTPNRFCVELCPVRSVHDTDRSIKHFRRTRIMLGASTPEVREQWARAFSTWHRRNWKDTTVISAFDDEAKALRMVMIVYRLELKLLRFTDLTLRKVNMDPQTSDPIYDISKHQTHSTAMVPGPIQVTRPTNTFGFQSVFTNQIAL